MNCPIPNTIQAGVNFIAAVSLPSYSGWEVLLYLRGPSQIDLVGEQSGDTFTFAADAATTATWTPGEYAYSMRATNGGDVVEVGSGRTTITPDLAQMPAGTDVRSKWRIGLDAIEAVLDKRATLDQERYRINNRELYRTPIPDLLKLRGFYQQKVNEEACCGGGKRRRWGDVRVGFGPIGR